MMQSIFTLTCLHTQSVANLACRDLKLDNTLLDDSDPPMLKLCDFGFAKTWTEDANMFTHIGYAALSNCILKPAPGIDETAAAFL